MPHATSFTPPTGTSTHTNVLNRTHGGTGAHAITGTQTPASAKVASAGVSTDLMAMLQADREYALNSARETNAFNAAEAKKARDWQEYMSNTSHQREVKDLIAAGLNPVLSANGGANAYQAAVASGVKPDTPSGANALSNIMAASITAGAMTQVASINAGSALAVAQEQHKNSMYGSAWTALEKFVESVRMIPMHSSKHPFGIK